MKEQVVKDKSNKEENGEKEERKKATTSDKAEGQNKKQE